MKILRLVAKRPYELQLRALKLSALLLTLLLISCSSNPAEHDHDECDHFEAEGLIVKLNDSVIVQQFQGETVGAIAVTQNQAIRVLVVFLDPDSVAIEIHDDDCPDHSLGWTIGDEAIVSIAKVANERWVVDISGLAAGSTTIRFRIFHGDHADFTSLPIDVNVAAPRTEREGW